MIYEGGAEKHRINSTQQNPAYVAGDLFKVEVVSGVVKYYKNGVLLYTSQNTPVFPLLFDASVFHMNAQVQDAWLCSTPGNDGPSGSGSGSGAQPEPSKTAQKGTGSSSGTKPSGVTTTSSTTLYIGNLYEEELTGTSNPPYTSYYSFGGKMVGMRRANQPDPATNGQLRMVGDHLGSTTLVLDTSAGTSGPQVIHRQYYKPYGEVATQSGSSRTSIGYTGQRLDQDSGLMFYNARFYDPVLSYFVSADTIAPDKGDPKSRNRYSYVVNNPVKYTDPSGHCIKEAQGNPDKARECAAYLAEMQKYGVIIDARQLNLGEWTLEDVFLALTAIKDMAAKGNGGKGWSPAEFKAQMGLTGGQLLTLRNGVLNYIEGPDKARVETYQGCADASDCKYGQFNENDPLSLTLDLKALRLYRGAGQRGNPEDQLKVSLVHELAHRWDFANGGTKSRELWGKTHHTVYGTEYEYGAAGVPSGYADQALHDPQFDGDRAAEYWADSVAAYVYPRARHYAVYAHSYNNSLSYRYARDSFK